MLKKILLFFIPVCIIVSISYLYYRQLTLNPETDDAYVRSNLTQISSQVPGIIKKIFINDNQIVKKNQKLVELNDEQYIFDLDIAQENLKLAKQDLKAKLSDLKVAKSNIASHEAQLTIDQKTYNRIKKLYNEKQVSASEMDKATAKLKATMASLEGSKNSLQKLENLIGENHKTTPQITNAETQLKQTQLNIQRTTIYAPSTGAISNLNIREGMFIQPGQNLFAIVHTDDYWISANFKETQLQNIKIGDKANIYIDMYPNKKFEGIVESISYSSTNTFSLFPAENASGNWVKVTQRFPVRIKFINPDPAYPLRVGASASVRIEHGTNR